MTKQLVLILPSLTSGGMERVMSELAYYFSKINGIKVTLILLTKGEKFYKLPSNVILKEPSFNHENYNKIIQTFKIAFFLRKTLKSIKPTTLLSFGGKYNSFVLLSSFGLNIKCFISDRSRPSISYGRILDFLNPFVYRLADGIIAQTEIAQKKVIEQLKHKNVRVIGNPIIQMERNKLHRQNIILNVGRFINSKHQMDLVNIFANINPIDWKLIFLGDGPNFENVKREVELMGLSERVVLLGNVKNIFDYYETARIFAFTSSSEGFPNSLGEAMSGGLACISYNCEAGPADIIDDNINGFLIETHNKELFKGKLNILMNNESLCSRFAESGTEKMNGFSIDNIGAKYARFMKLYNSTSIN